LPAGNYIARYRVYNEDEVKQEGELSLMVQPYGTLQEAGFGFSGLSIPHKISLILPILALLVIILYFFYNRRVARRSYE
jgi:lipopolysaccharide export LptBFGC system permease protein LptF